MSENGFLTERDRKFLLGEKEYTGKNAKQLRYQTRRAIRERTRAAFRDFSLLYDALDEEERNKIFNITNKPFDLDAGITPETRDGLIDMFAFLYLSLEGEEGSPSPWGGDVSIPRFKDLLEAGVAKGEADRHPDSDARRLYTSSDLSVEVTGEIDTKAAAEKLARGEIHALSEAELRGLVQTARGNVDDFALEPLIDEKRKELGMDPDEIRSSVQEWFEDTHAPDNETTGEE